MKWCTKKHGQKWYTGPEQGRVIHYAKKNGVKYEVQAVWRNPFNRDGGIIWYSFDGKGHNNGWRTLEAAVAWCERDAETNDINIKSILAEGL